MILLLGQIVNVVSGSVGNLLNMSGNEKDLNNVAILAGILVTILNFSLIPVFGVLGAAISTAIAISFQNISAAFYVKKRLGFNVYLFWKK